MTKYCANYSGKYFHNVRFAIYVFRTGSHIVHFSRPFVYLVCIFTVMMLAALPGPALSSQCKLVNLKASEGSLGYQKRPDSFQTSERCEGLYESPVNSDFEVLSLLWGNISYDKHSTLQVHWPTQTIFDALFVTGTSKTPGIFYRMDAVMIRGTPFYWPVSDVLEKIRVSPQELGVIGWFKVKNKIVYVPLLVSTFNQSKNTVVENIATLVVRADFDLEKIILRKSGDQDSANWMIIRKRFSASEPITLDISRWTSVSRNKNISLQVIGKVIDDDEQLIETFDVRFIH